MVNCFVGNYGKCGPINVASGVIHPTKFAEYVAGLEHDIFTNNPYVVDQFPGDKVFIIDEHGNQLHLSAMKGYSAYSKDFGSGELWSLVGEKWVAERLRELECDVLGA